MMDAILAWAAQVPRTLVYVALGAGAGLEKVIPAIPADTFVLLGGVVSAAGALEARWVFLATWAGNVGSAIAMYYVGRTRGRIFFELGWGRHILNDAQIARMTDFSARWGGLTVFLTRFLPGLRAVVPVFAGVSRQRASATVVPIALASAIWYGALVWLGTLAGHNLEKVFVWVADVNYLLLFVAILVGCAVGFWWWRTRHRE